MFCFCFGHNSYALRKFAGLNKREVGKGRRSPPFANTMLALGLLNCCLNSPPKAQQVLRLLDVLNYFSSPPQKAQQVFGLKLLPKSSTKGPASVTPFQLLPKPSTKAQQVSGLLNCCLNPPQKAQQSVTPSKLLPKPSKKGPAS